MASTDEDWPSFQAALNTAATSHVVDVLGADIHYRVWPGPSSTRRRPLLLVHGLLGHSHWWDAVAGWLQRDRPVVALDFSGMGDSGRRQSYERRVHAMEIAAVARAAQLDGAHLVAHSYGGDPAIRACIDNPDLFFQLVLLDSRLRLPGFKEFDLAGQSVPEKPKFYPSAEKARKRFRLVPDSDAPHADMLNHIAHHSMRPESDGWTWKFDGKIVASGERKGGLDVHPLKTDVTFIRGADSNVTTPQQMDITRQHLPDARYMELPDAGHHVMVDQPLQLARMLREIMGEG